MKIIYDLHSRNYSKQVKDSFKYSLYKGGNCYKTNIRLFGNFIDNNNPFLKALNLKYED